MEMLPDVADWGRVYEAHAARLTRLASVIAGPAAAHDLVADAVLRAVSSPTWISVKNHGAYLTRTLVNVAASQHQAQARRETRERAVVSAQHRSFSGPDGHGDFDDVHSALLVLSPGERGVVFLHYWQDLSLTETADQLGVSVGSVRKQLHRAKRKLRRALDQQEVPQ